MSEEDDLHHIPLKTLSEVIAMTSQEMATASPFVACHMKYLMSQAESIADTALKKQTLQLLENPAPTFMVKLSRTVEQAKITDRLVSAGLYDKNSSGTGKNLPLFPPAKDYRVAPQPFSSAPGSGYFRHHAYPGGLAVHTSVNLRSALALSAIYEESYAVSTNQDILIAAQIAHDCQKPWVLQWLENGRIFPQATLAFTGSHHVFGLAETMTRNFPPEVIIAQACAHNHLAAKEAEALIVGWLRAAAILAGKDPVKEKYLEPSGRILNRPRRLENCMTHLGDHNWVVSLPASQWSSPLLERLAVQEYRFSDSDLKGRPFYQLRNYIFSQVTTLLFYDTYAQEGMNGLRRLVRRFVKPE